MSAAPTVLTGLVLASEMADRRLENVRSAGDRRQELLDILLKSAKKCQDKFGQRAELATDYNEQVSELCLKLEMIFQHGLKTPGSSLSMAVLRNVKDLVSNNFNSPTEGGGLWRVIRPVLNKHEYEREAKLNILFSNDDTMTQ